MEINEFCMKRRLLIVISLLCVSCCLGQNHAINSNSQETKIKVIAQMNYCISAMTQIVNNKSMSVLQHESDQLRNNLTMTEAIGVPEIQSFRNDLMNAIANFEITEEERQLTKRVMSIKRDAQKWDALASALSAPMVLTQSSNLYQGAFYTLLTAARTVVEYKKSSSEIDIEELKAMWSLRKEDLNGIKDLRSTAFQNTMRLYEKYHLRESDRLTEETVEDFVKYISESNNQKRLRLLLDNQKKFSVFPSYYYHVGMAYLDLMQYDNAKPYFDKYLAMYSQAPIFKYDEMSGCIALVKLQHEKKLSLESTEKFIDMAISNMPNNSAAILHCALIYISKYKKVEKGLDLIRAGIDNPKSSDKDLLILAASKLLHQAKQYSCYGALKHAIESSDNLDMYSYVNYLLMAGYSWNTINNNIKFEDVSYRNKTLWGTHLNDNIQIVLTPKLVFNPNSVNVFIETHNDEDLLVRELLPVQEGMVTQKDIDDVECFKKNKDLKCLFVETIETNKIYVVKKGMDLGKIKSQNFPRMGEFVLSSSDIDDIVEFCEDNMPKSLKTKLLCKPNKETSGQIQKFNTTNNVTIKYVGNNQHAYYPFHTKKMQGDYLRIVFNDGTTLMYKYNKETKQLDPYLSICLFSNELRYKTTQLAKIEDVDNQITKEAASSENIVVFVNEDGTMIRLSKK